MQLFLHMLSWLQPHFSPAFLEVPLIMFYVLFLRN